MIMYGPLYLAFGSNLFSIDYPLQERSRLACIRMIDDV